MNQISVQSNRVDPMTGDIASSYSATEIPDGKVREPFTYGARVYVTVAIYSNHENNQCVAYALSDARKFHGVTTTYKLKVGHDHGEAARNDPNGFYHGIAVKIGGSEYVLVGPPVLFVGEESVKQVKQLEMAL